MFLKASTYIIAINKKVHDFKQEKEENSIAIFVLFVWEKQPNKKISFLPYACKYPQISFNFISLSIYHRSHI